MTNDPDLSRAARDYIFENDVWLYHEYVTPTEHGFWVEAKDLRVGDVFLGANGELSTLINVVRIEYAGNITVYNFSVEGNHNYFVIAREDEYGQTCVLVHNANKFYGVEPNNAGKIGEARAGIEKNTKKVNVDGRNRIPDEITDTTITEVKNVKYQHLSTQLKDDLALAAKDGKDVRLVTRTDTKISKPLQAKIDEGLIIHDPIIPPGGGI